jgi:hypothetical protein
MVIDSNIIEKIRKLRTITGEHGATEEEAIAAEQRMFALLAKHNLVFRFENNFTIG